MRKSSKWLTLAIAVLIIASIGLVACGNNDSTAPAQTTTETGGNQPTTNDDKKEPEQTSEPQELHLMGGAEPPSMDAQITTDAESFIYLNAVQEGLVRVGPNGIVPGVAESWEVSPDGTKYTFKLRDSKWSNGDPVTAQNFADAWERAANAANAAQYANMIFDNIKGAKEYYDYTNYLVLKDMYDNNRTAYEEANKAEDGTVPTPDVVAFGEAKTDIQPVAWDSVGVKVVDEKTLEVELKQATAYWLELTAFATYLPFNKAFYEANVDTYATEADKLLFNGPFVLSEWLHEQRLVLEKNPNYWDAANVKLETITFDIVKDSATALALYEAGDVDRTGLSSQNVPLYKDDPNFKTKTDLVHFYLVFNTTKKPFNNAKVRKALSYAIDRQAYVDTLLNNGSLPAYGLVPTGFMAYSGASETFREASAKKFGGQLFSDNNVEEAKKLLAEGLAEEGIDPAKFTFDFMSGDTESSIKSSEFLKSLWKQTLNVEVSLSNVPFAERLDRSRTQQFDVVLSGWGPDFNDPDTWMFLFETDGPYNDGKYSNPEYDRLVAEARQALDPNERLDKFLQAEKILVQDDHGIAPVYFRAGAYLQQPYVKGILEKNFGSDFEFKWAYIEGKQQ